MEVMSSPLIEWTEQGLYCRAGQFYIDPNRAVETAVITHAHSDHARRGCKRYICTESGHSLLKARLGSKINSIGYPYRQSFNLANVQVSFHSAGHILGSAQVRIQYDSEIWLVSGDYKREDDPSCEPFEIVNCDTFITEATFGTPKYVWSKNQKYGHEIHQWWKSNAKQGKNSLLFGYSLGKAQRILAELEPYAHRPIIIHHSISDLTECYRNAGRRLALTVELASILKERPLNEDLILAPPSILKSEWLQALGEYRTAFASGWILPSSEYHQSWYDHGFVMSDHADWNDLNRTIEETGAKRVFVLHRSYGALVRHLRKKGLEAYPVSSLTQKKYQSICSTNLTLF